VRGLRLRARAVWREARRAISCTYGGGVRPMKLDVLYCTDYRARDAPLRPSVIGFVYEIASAE
jgi:hypothetical protein